MGNIMTCQDVDECEMVTGLGDDKCAVFEKCINTDGSYKCEVSPDPLGLCVGTNSPCYGIPRAKCVVADTKFTASCSCPMGYIWGPDGDGKYGCHDHDECQTGAHACLASQFCANLEGGYHCGEHEGPCAIGTHECHEHARCVPSYAKRGYDCECLPGFFGNG